MLLCAESGPVVMRSMASHTIFRWWGPGELLCQRGGYERAEKEHKVRGENAAIRVSRCGSDHSLYKIREMWHTNIRIHTDPKTDSSTVPRGGRIQRFGFVPRHIESFRRVWAQLLGSGGQTTAVISDGGWTKWNELTCASDAIFEDNTENSLLQKTNAQCLQESLCPNGARRPQDYSSRPNESKKRYRSRGKKQGERQRRNESSLEMTRPSELALPRPSLKGTNPKCRSGSRQRKQSTGDENQYL